jgi:hypothetical protein
MASQSTASNPGAIDPVKAARIAWGAVRMARLLDQLDNFPHFIQSRTSAMDKKRPGRPARQGWEQMPPSLRAATPWRSIGTQNIST